MLENSLVGKNILHYKIIEQLGQGGMGVVYKAEDTKLKREVAIKFLPGLVAVNKEQRKRFTVEAQAAASLNHQNITTIYSIEETHDQIFIVMEYIEGEELKSFISSGISSGERMTRLSSQGLNDIINYAVQIADGLEAAHNKGIVHRDIKSQNIMITKDGKAKIMDFGLAKIREGNQLTQMGTTIGTIAYMSPEQASGIDVDYRSDIFSFGVVLYELITGKLPFRGDYDQVIIYSILNDEPDLTILKQQNCPLQLIDIISKCLDKNQKTRYQSTAQLSSDLKMIQKILLGGIKLSFFENVKALIKSIKIRKRTVYITALSILIFAAIILLAGGKNIFFSIFSTSGTSAENHLLILPLNIVGGDATRQAFSDGLVETLSSNLTQIERFQSSLWVVPSSEVVQNKIKSISEAHKMFGVNLVVTGSLQFMNNLLRLTLNLVDAKNLRQLNSSIIDIKSEEISSTQDKAVIQLLQMLHIEMEPQLKDIMDAGKTTVPKAYEYYVQGRGNLQRYENLENIDQAINFFELAAGSDKNYTMAYAGLGEAYWRKYEITKKPEFAEFAMTKAKKAFKLDSLLAPINVTLGMIYSGTGNHTLAIETFKRALAIEPSDAAALRGLAKAYESSGDISEAESTFKRAIKLKPDYWAGYNDLGVFYYKHSRYEDAISQFKEVIRLTPDNYKGYNNVGGIYYMLERWSEARDMFERSLKIRKSYSIYSNLGTLYYIEGRFEDAASTYNRALELNSSNYLTWGNLAAAYNSIPDKKEKAVETYKHAIEMAEGQLKINPNDCEIISNLAAYNADIGNEKKALNLLTRSLKIAPDDIQVFYRAATIYEHLGNREKALLWIGKAIENGYSKSEIEHQPELKDLVADARYKKIAENYSDKK